MNTRMQHFLTKIRTFGSLTFTLIQLIASILGITTVISTSIIVWLLRFQNWLLPATMLLSGAGITLMFVSIFNRKPYSRWRGYKNKRVEYVYELHDDKRHTQTITTEIKAMEAGIDTFYDTYRWSGLGDDSEPVVVNPGHRSLGRSVKQDGWIYHYIDLGHELNVGEVDVIKVMQKFYDRKSTFQPFLSNVISQPTDCLVLRVIFPQNSLLDQIVLSERDADGPAGVLVGKVVMHRSFQMRGMHWPAKGLLGKISIGEREICWQIRRPRPGHKYEIRWQ